MRLLYLHRTRVTGAEGRHIRGIVHGYERRGWRVSVVSPPGITLEESTASRPQTRISRLWTIISDHIPQVFFELCEMVYNVYSLAALSHVLNSDPPDLIYERYSLFNFAGAWMARRHGIPIILEVNGCTTHRMRPLRWRWLAQKIECWVFRNASYIAIVSQNHKELITNAYGIPPDHVVVHHNAVDVSHFERSFQHGAKKNHDFTLGMVAAFIPWHGLEFLIATVADFLRQTGARLLLVGDGPSLLSVKKTIHNLGLDSYVELTGRVSSAAVPDLLARMDVCIMADSNQYGSPMKIFEYMTMGKPVLAPAYAPIQEIITPGVNGLLFEPLNSESLLKCVEMLYGNPELRERLGMAARRTIVSCHTWDHRVRALDDWFYRFIYQDANRSGDAGVASGSRGESVNYETTH